MPMTRIIRKIVTRKMKKKYICYPGLDKGKLHESLEILSRFDGDGTREAEDRGGKRVQPSSTAH